jgi:hypothetical protein
VFPFNLCFVPSDGSLSAALDRVIEPSRALVILAYGTRHNDVVLMNKAAEHTLEVPAQQVFAALAPDAFLAWVRISMTLF